MEDAIELMERGAQLVREVELAHVDDQLQALRKRAEEAENMVDFLKFDLETASKSLEEERKLSMQRLRLLQEREEAHLNATLESEQERRRAEHAAAAASLRRADDLARANSRAWFWFVCWLLFSGSWALSLAVQALRWAFSS